MQYSRKWCRRSRLVIVYRSAPVLAFLVIAWSLAPGYYGRANAEKTAAPDPPDVVTSATPPLPRHALTQQLPPGNLILGYPSDTAFTSTVRIRVEGIGTFTLAATDVETSRPDLFAPGHFSAFDAVTAALKRSGIPVEYTFDPELDTHIITSIGGIPGPWWYKAHYDGGGFEDNAYRMDCYVVKEKTEIQLYRLDHSRFQRILDSFRAEMARLHANGGKVIIPVVYIQGPSWKQEFHDVEVRPFALRPDTLRPGVITAADVLLSLAEQGKLTLDAEWVETIGNVIVKGFYFTRINQDHQAGRAGWIYETGSDLFRGQRLNLIHVTTDLRILHSPDYLLLRWADLGGGAEHSLQSEKGGLKP